jgi:protein MAK11
MEGLGEHEILVGTYEQYVLGYKIAAVGLKDEEKWELTPTFNVHAHSGPVRSIGAGAKYAFSGGTDEVCKIFDMTTRTEHGTLMHHDGTVSCLATHAPSHLLTASDDNSIAVVRMGSFQIEKTLYKHSAGITAMAMHPTGKICFSAGKDKKLITWNLVKARPAFIINLKGIAEFLTVSPDGCRYAVGIHRRVDIYSIESAGVEYTIDLKARPNCLVFLNNDTVVVGGEGSQAQIHSLIERCLLKSWDAHQTRIRVMQLLSPTVLVTASSCDTCIKLWKVDSDRLSPVTLLASKETQCRVTCLTVWHPGLRNAGSKKKKITEVEEVKNSPEKKIKLDEKKASNLVETLTVTEEISVQKKEKVKKKRKKKSEAEAVTADDLDVS